MEHEINILVVEPGRPPRPARVDNSLETFSQLVGGELAMGCYLPQRVMRPRCGRMMKTSKTPLT